jgi:hypothetical protein
MEKESSFLFTLELEFIKSEQRNTGIYCHFHEANKLEMWYIYRNRITGEIIEMKTKLEKQ